MDKIADKVDYLENRQNDFFSTVGRPNAEKGGDKKGDEFMLQTPPPVPEGVGSPIKQMVTKVKEQITERRTQTSQSTYWCYS